jgi:2-methylcitrate dehydratase PrpD
MTMTLTEHLTEMGMSLGVDAITPSAYAAAKKMLLDALGCALAGHREPGAGESAAQMAEWGGKPEASILLYGARAPAPNAAFANSAMIHALDYDDVYMPPGALHLTSMMVPAMLAGAEMSGATGREALAAMIMGFEIAGRLGIVECEYRRSAAFLPSSIDGGFGAVVTMARLLGLTPDQCADAMGINYAQAAGNRQALHDMTLTKRIQPALAVRSALWAVALARRGVTGPRRALEGESGFFKTYLNGEIPDAEEFTRPKDWFEVENTAIKRYTSCGAGHPCQEAAEILAREEDLQPADIDRVEIFPRDMKDGIVGQPFEIGRNPQVDAQFSAAYAVAFALLRGTPRIEDFTDEAVRAHTDVAELAKQVGFAETPDEIPEILMDAPPDYLPYATRSYGVIVHTRDGRRLVRARCPAQTFEALSVTFDDVVPKYRACAAYSGVCDQDRSEAILEAVRTLDSAPSIDGLLDLLRGPALPR